MKNKWLTMVQKVQNTFLDNFEPEKNKSKELNIVLSEKDSENLRVILNEKRTKKKWKEKQIYLPAGISRSGYNLLKKGYYSTQSIQAVFDVLEIDLHDEKYSQFLPKEPRKKVRRVNHRAFALLFGSIALILSLVSYLAVVVVQDDQTITAQKEQETIQIEKSDSLALEAPVIPKSEVQSPTPANQEQALAELKNAGGSLSQLDIDIMLRDGNVALLELASKAGMQMFQIETGLRKNSISFFKAIKRDQIGNNWFAKQFKNGLNPELRVLMKERGEVSILNAAIVGENIDASLALLDAGASPHFFQEIHTKRHSTPSFLFPLRSIVRFNRLSRPQKKKLIEAMIKHGAVFYQPVAMSTSKTPGQTGDGAVIDVTTSMPQIAEFTVKKPKSIELNPTFERSRLRCEAATRLADKDWCKIMDNVPTLIEVHDQRLSDVYRVYVQDLINVSDGSAFFFVTHIGGFKSIYGLLEVTPDHDHYNLYLYGSRGGQGKGTCEGENGNRASSFCWQVWTIQKLSKLTAKVNEEFDANLLYPDQQ